LKVRVNLLMDKEIVEKAKEMGLNLSKCCENCLRTLIKAMERGYSANAKRSFLGEPSFVKEGSVDGAGFEPAASTMPTWRSFQADLPAQTHSN
jgi:hypothetical protein